MSDRGELWRGASRRAGRAAGQPDTRAEARGERLYQRYCYQCHPGGAAGLGPALNNKPLPAIAIRTQIRNGVGAMPAFDAALLSDQDVDAITEYVEDLRATRPTHASRTK